jgi:4'-phosphopantetheinyl transferase EntD
MAEPMADREGGRAGLLGPLLPAGVAWAEAYDDPPGTYLFPEEEARLARAVDKRRREFTTARRCAREALAQLGVGPVPIVPGERGAPRWPDGIAGSMTHTSGYRAAAVARAGGPDDAVVSVGIDAEPHEPLPRGVERTVVNPPEAARLAALAASHPATHWDRLLFCAKEAVYKAWFPLTERWLGFDEADVAVEVGGTFTARLLVAGPVVDGVEVRTFPGRWAVGRGLVAAAITLHRP